MRLNYYQDFNNRLLALEFFLNQDFSNILLTFKQWKNK